MDDSLKPNISKVKTRYPLGMSSFGPSEREKFGQKVRLAMGCIEASSPPVKGKAIPSDETSLRARLKTLSQEMSSQHADLLAVLIKFDDLQGWKTSGASHCAAWMNVEIGISLQLSWEYLRVGRKLLRLPILNALFRAGKLSWSKVRLISRVADQDSEPLLCHAALDASVSQVKRLCDEYRWGEDGNSESDIKSENDRALKQWDSRSLTWSNDSNGSTRIQLTLPPELAQAFLNSVEHSLNQLDTTDNKMAQRRADAAMLMAETSLRSCATKQGAGKAIATADRYQVMVSVEASELTAAHGGHKSDNTSSSKATDDNIIPSKRPTVRGAGPIARETARRITCDCSLSIIKTANGEPVNIGRKSRIWPNAMERAIKDRDQHCVWPGCTQSRHLHIHHIKHWADGGATSVETLNGLTIITNDCMNSLLGSNTPTTLLCLISRAHCAKVENRSTRCANYHQHNTDSVLSIRKERTFYSDQLLTTLVRNSNQPVDRIAQINLVTLHVTLHIYCVANPNRLVITTITMTVVRSYLLTKYLRTIL